MRHKTFMSLASLIFLLVAAMHLYRAFKGFPMVYGNFRIPVIASWVGGFLALYLAYQGFKHRR